MVIDNFDLIKSLMPFEEGDNLFMHLQILRRGKDHPDLPAANKLIKVWLVRSKEHLDSLKDEVVFLCEHYKARAYISCAPKSIAKLNTLIMRKLADNLHTGNVINPWHVFNSACGELQGVEKRWVVDIDDKELFCSGEIDTCIDGIWLKAHPESWGLKRKDRWWVGAVSTLNGIHYITRPFNLQEFHKHFPDVEIKKNGLTALYVPECICNPETKYTMTDNELDKLAIDYSEKACSDFVSAGLIHRLCKGFLTELLRDHCVVSKEKIEQVKNFVGSEGAQVAIHLLFGSQIGKEGEE